MFSGRDIPNVPLAGRLKFFLPAWETLTKDSQVLGVVTGYKIPLLNTPIQKKLPIQNLSQQQVQLVTNELQDLLRKGAIHKSSHCDGEFLSNVFLVAKKDGGQRRS